MPYVERSAGVIVGAYSRPQTGRAEELLDETDAELVAFRERKRTPAESVAGAIEASPIGRTLVAYLAEKETRTEPEVLDDFARLARDRR